MDKDLKIDDVDTKDEEEETNFLTLTRREAAKTIRIEDLEKESQKFKERLIPTPEFTQRDRMHSLRTSPLAHSRKSLVVENARSRSFVPPGYETMY